MTASLLHCIGCMQDDKIDPRVAENARIAAQQVQDKIDEMAKTTEYKVDEAVRIAAQASRAHEPERPTGMKSTSRIPQPGRRRAGSRSHHKPE
jgi:hypothetical protein